MEDFPLSDHPEPRPHRIPLQVAMFPLPNVVFFPGTLLPLHIFEERYKLMVRECLEGEGYLGMLLMKQGWEDDYYNAEPCDTGCVGRIVQYEELPDGRLNILLEGLERVGVTKYEQIEPYRVALVSVLADEETIFSRREEMVAQLRRLYRKAVPERFHQAYAVALLEDMEKILDPSRLTDFMANHFPMDVHEKQKVLEAANLRRRITLMLAHLSAGLAHRN